MVAKLPRGARPYTAEPRHTLSNLCFSLSSHTYSTRAHTPSNLIIISLYLFRAGHLCGTVASGLMCCMCVCVCAGVRVGVSFFFFFFFCFHFLLRSILPRYEIRRLISSCAHNLNAAIKKTLLDKLTQ